MADSIEQRVASYKAALQTLSPHDVVRKHIVLGSCFSLPEDKYIALKSDVGNQFKVHPNDVIVVGSAKLGFSIAPKKTYRAFGDESDIDVAIVSPDLFDLIWKEAFTFSKSGGYWPRLQEFQQYLFQGWIRPDKLPPAHSFAMAKSWWDFFTKVSASSKFGPYKISGGVYKSWFYLENYQTNCVDRCKKQLGEPA